MIDCRFIRNKYLFNIISQRLNENIERLNRGSEEPYTKTPGFPFEISEKELNKVKVYTFISKSLSSRYNMITYVTFPEYTELDEILDILSNENSEANFEIGESKLISCSDKVISSIYMPNTSIISRFPDSFQFQPNDRIFNVNPSNQDGHVYCCVEQILQESVNYVYFDITYLMCFPKIKIYSTKKNKFQEIPIDEETGFFKKITNFFTSIFTCFSEEEHPKID